MVAPIGFLFQLGRALEKFYSNLPLQDAHQFANRNFRWYRNQQMYMIVLNVELANNTVLPLAQHPYIVVDQFLYGSLQYAEIIFWNPNYIIITLINNMA